MKRIKQNNITAGSDRVVHTRRRHRRDITVAMKRSSSILLVYTTLLIAFISISTHVAIVSGFSPPRHRPSMYSSSSAMNRYHIPTLSRIKDNQQRHDMRSNDKDEIGGNLYSKPSSVEIQNNNSFKLLSRSILPSLTLSILLLFSINPNPANAGFGPSGGATTSSPPNLTTPSKIGVQETSEKKLKQLIGSTLNPNRLEEFNAQLDDITQTIMSIISSEDEVGLLEEYGDKFDTTQEETPSTESSSINTQPNSIEEREAALKASLKKRTTKDNLTLRQEQQAELERLQVLKLQIANQEKMLAKLEAQPCKCVFCMLCM